MSVELTLGQCKLYGIDLSRYALRLQIMQQVNPEATGIWRCPTCGTWGFLFRSTKLWGDDTSNAGLVAAVRANHKAYNPLCPDTDLSGVPRLVKSLVD